MLTNREAENLSSELRFLYGYTDRLFNIRWLIFVAICFVMAMYDDDSDDGDWWWWNNDDDYDDDIRLLLLDRLAHRNPNMNRLLIIPFLFYFLLLSS